MVRQERPCFALGRTVITRAANAAVPMDCVQQALVQHARGDWGEVGEEDAAANEDALVHGRRLLSAYRTPDDTRFWVITEWDRSVTTVLLPEDY